MYGGSPVRDKAFTYLDTITTKRIMSSQRAHDRRSQMQKSNTGDVEL
jgi:hypothetical protein